MVKRSIEWANTPEEGLVIKIKPALGKLLAGEAHKHARTARKEMLLAVRSIIDDAVKRMEAKETNTENRGTKIEVK